ncbi:hypothetical protein AX289_27170 [Methylorubrum populi]|nr:hypothetical protein AX289_27170 [Methylorubrum populi]
MTRSLSSAALLAVLSLAQQASARAEPAMSPAARKSLPADVVAYVDRRTGCNHWGGEDAYDADRGRQIAAAVEKLGCDTIDSDETRLRRRYGRDPAVLKALEAAEQADG